MTISTVTLKTIQGAVMTSGSSVTRALMHDGVAAKKALHNTDSVVGLVADSMGRSRIKLTGTDVDRNGVTRVGPSPDILHQVPRVAGEATVSSVGDSQPEEKTGFAMADPNSSMWNMCKAKDLESTAKKLTVKFKKMKDEIKQYYLDRLEENQVIFTEVDEPLRIGKLDKKDRMSKHKDMREDDIAPLEDIQAVQRMSRKSQKMSLFNQLQSKPETDAEEKLDDMHSEMKMEPQVKGYRKFNKHDYKKSGEEAMERDMESRGGRKLSGEECLRNDRMYSEQERQHVPSMWKRQQLKGDKEGKEIREGGFTDVLGTMAPANHFKIPKIGLRSNGLLDKIKSSDMIQGFCDKRLNVSRGYCTLMRKTKEQPNIYDKFKPENMMLGLDIASQNQVNRSIVNKMVPAHHLSTSSTLNNADDNCRPQSLPPKDCTPKDKLIKCPQEGPKWPPCPKICLCGCDPPSPRVDAMACFEWKGFLSLAKRPEYICPAFSECQRRTEMNTKRLSECCFRKNACDKFVGPARGFVTAQERQEINLGQKYWSAKKQQCSNYHTSARRFAATEDDCERPEKKQLPCQKSYNVPGMRKKEKPKGLDKGNCDKICMPCCEPARDPPECFSLYQKPPCTKMKNPRPSFSECQRKFPFKHTMCECEVPSKPRCEKKENYLLII